jgi:hypothetical protein
LGQGFTMQQGWLFCGDRRTGQHGSTACGQGTASPKNPDTCHLNLTG